MRRCFLFAVLWLAANAVEAGSQPPAKDGPAHEANIELAKQWWPDLTDIWTPVGWKHHRARYNVFFDGTLLAQPDLSMSAKAWEGQGVQLHFVPGLPATPEAYAKLQTQRYFLFDDRMEKQGWTGNTAPVLWTEWSADGLLLRQHVFAHIPGARPVKTSVEPLFAWVRLSVHWVAPGLPVPDKYAFRIQINAPHVTTSMRVRYNILMHHDRASYPRGLRTDAPEYDRTRGVRLIEPDGKIRLAVAPGAQVQTGFLPGDSAGKDPLLYINFTARKGEYVDLLVPMVPTDRDVFDRELALGYDKALAEADAFWSKRPASAATIDVPEQYVNDSIRQFMRYAEVIAEKIPEEGWYTLQGGSLAYVRLWSTPTAKTVSMLLDPMGYKELAGDYLEPFIQNQGKRPPPSEFLAAHPGYLGSPARFKAIDWMADHGALLFAIANHALMSGDRKTMERYVDPVLKACEFIRDARRVKGHGGVEGLLPPARNADTAWHTQGVWSDGWAYKGLTTSVRLLKKLNHPRAAEFAAEAEDYKRTFVAALREATSKSGTWTDSRGATHHFVPSSLHGFQAEAARHSFYLDTGPLMLVFAGLLDARDPLMTSTLEWLRAGPSQELKRFGGTFNQVPFLRHEMSSSIPGYSWNIFHSHQLGDRAHFLEAMYSLYTGMISQQTKTVCESRGGITGRVIHADAPVYMSRLAMIDDQVAPGELHLLRIAPLAWIRSDYETRFENMPTEFGPVTLKVRLSADKRTLQVSYVPQYWERPAKVLLHAPPVPGLAMITMNGRALAWKPGQESILVQ